VKEEKKEKKISQEIGQTRATRSIGGAEESEIKVRDVDEQIKLGFNVCIFYY